MIVKDGFLLGSRQSHQQVSSLIDFFPDPTFAIDRAGRVILWNKAVEDLTGIPAREIMGKGDYEYAMRVYGERRPLLIDLALGQQSEITQSYEIIEQNGDVYTAEVFIPSLAGKPVYLWAKAAPLRDEDGTVVGAIESMRDITVRRQMVIDLQQSHQWLSMALQSGNMAVWDLDLHTSLLKIFGPIKFRDSSYHVIPNVELPFAEYARFFNTDDWHRLKQVLQVYARGEAEDFTFQGRMKVKPDTWRWICLNGSAVQRDEGNKPVRVMGTSFDVTQLVEMQNSLFQAEQRWSLLVEQSPLAFIEWDDDMRVRSWNPAAERIFGYCAAEAVGKLADDLILPAAICAQVHGYFQQILDRKSSLHVGNDNRTKDGRTLHCEWFNTPLIDRDGQVLGVASLAMDVTEKRASETQLREAKALLDEAQHLSKTGSWEALLPAREITWSDQLYRILGYEPGSVEPSAALFARHVHPDDIDLFQRISAGADLSGIEAEFRIITVDGDTRWIAVLTQQQRDADGQTARVCSTIQDITDRKHAEEQLRRAQKMEAVGCLSSGIAHDFNNILSAIYGYTELAMAEADRESTQYASLSQVIKAADRARDVVKHILSISKMQEVQLQPVPVTPLLNEVISFMRAGLPATIAIETRFQADNDVINADSTQIHQVFMNLCTNAGQAMQDGGGLLEALVENVDLDQNRMLHGTQLHAGRYVHIAVSDSGCGIDPGNIDRIFDPYFSTKDQESNSGLGLAVVHGVVSRHGGGIAVRSTVGAGTTVDLYFPAIDAVSATRGGAQREVVTGTERILFVDDEPSIVDFNTQILTPSGFQVTGTTNPVEAISIFEQDPDAFDLLICDKTMPRLTGFDVVRAVKALRPQLPVILCTGFRDPEDVQKCADLGIDELVAKPIPHRDFGRVIRDVLDRHHP